MRGNLAKLFFTDIFTFALYPDLFQAPCRRREREATLTHQVGKGTQAISLTQPGSKKLLAIAQIELG